MHKSCRPHPKHHLSLQLNSISNRKKCDQTKRLRIWHGVNNSPTHGLQVVELHLSGAALPATSSAAGGPASAATQAKVMTLGFDDHNMVMAFLAIAVRLQK